MVRAEMARKRLTLHELREIAKKLKDADLDIAQEFVIKEVRKEQHIYLFDDRKALWCYLTGDSTVAFRQLLKDGVNKFCALYTEECAKGADRHLRLLMAWNKYVATYAVPSISTISSSNQWAKLTGGYQCAVSEECRSACLQYSLVLLDNLRSQCEMALCQEESISVSADDDVTLYRLFGFSLHASMHFRSRSCWGRSRMAKRYSLEKRMNFRKQVSVLKLLTEKDKSVIPAILKEQDRGRMKFPCQTLIPFCRACSVHIKTTLNMRSLLKDGRKISKVRLTHISIDRYKRLTDVRVNLSVCVCVCMRSLVPRPSRVFQCCTLKNREGLVDYVM